MSLRRDGNGLGKTSTRSGLPDVLVDSNILVYAHDPRDRAKQQQARSLLATLSSRPGVALSVQCLTEFFSSVIRLPDPMPPADAFHIVDQFREVFEVLPLTERDVLLACAASAEQRRSIWDTIIWSVAKSNGVVLILTEDLPGQPVIDGVRYVNPFAADFDLATLSLRA